MRRVVLVLVLAVAGCPGSGPDDMTTGADLAAGPLTAETACDEMARALCDKLAACAPGFLAPSYGDVATCVARNKLTCPLKIGLAGSSATPVRVRECARAYPTAPCEAFTHPLTLPAPCLPAPGALPDGAPCGDSAQCKSAHCHFEQVGFNPPECGTCAPRAGQGMPCAGDDCQAGLVCAGNFPGTCAKEADLSQPCDFATPCRFGLLCAGGFCARPPRVGGACESSEDCDRTQGHACSPTYHVCQPGKLAKGGQRCGPVVDDVYLCTGGSQCSPPQGGTCVGPVRDGDKCDSGAGSVNPCLTPASCLGGVCKIDDPRKCH